MYTFHHTAWHLKSFKTRQPVLNLAFLMVFFWAIFDGIATYIMPLIISEHGYSKTEMGMIIGSSSLVGAIFDLAISRYIRNPHYRKLYFSVFILSFIFLILLYGASTLWIYFISMGLWGIYWDLYHFANFDFVSRVVSKSEHASAFGVMGIFHSLGNLLAPIIGGLVIATIVDFKPFAISGLMLLISFVVFLVFYFQSIKIQEVSFPIERGRLRWITEIELWKKIGWKIPYLLLLTLIIHITDAFFWTIGPLVAEGGEFGNFGGILMVAYIFPVLITGWFVGNLASKFGKEKTALGSFILGSMILIIFGLVSGPFVMIGVVFFASCLIGIALPALNGAYADYIVESKEYEKEIQGVVNLFYNIGWMVGPAIAGIAADIFGKQGAFTVLGIFSVITCTYLFIKMPKKVHLDLE